MEVREVFKVEDPTTPGRQLSVHLTESELVDVVQAGLFFLLQQGFINFKAFTEDDEPDIELPPNATAQ